MSSVGAANTTMTDPPAVATPSPAEAQAMHAMIAFLTSRFHTLQLFLLAGYGIMFLLCVALIGYLRVNRNSALRGDASAARKVVLPAFEPLLWVLAAATGVYTTFFCVALAIELYTYDISKLATEVFYSGRQFVFLSVVVFMLQTSVSGPALRRSLLLTFVLATYTIPVAWFMAKYRPKTEFYAVITAVRSPMLLLYTYILVRPPLRASKRTLREFCLFAYVYYALLFTYNDLFHEDKLEAGFVLTYANLLCGSLCPLVIWRVLVADTQHWRGMGHRAVGLQRLFQQSNRLPERVSSKGLHVLIEMHRKFIIDFAYLELKTRIGTGASAIVFNGLLRSSTPVAVKVYTPVEITDETIVGFSQETALCGALHHPNIVRFYGMCICPPTICLVSELCQGSLEDVMCAMARHNSAHQLSANRQQLLLNVAYMLDAARATAYMHSFRPAFLHRDIKPANFLVDREGTVKLTDFGESRPLPREQVAINSNGSKRDRALSRRTSNLSDAKGAMDIQVVVADIGPTMTVKGTVDYMAPEVINGRAGVAAYGEAADVFSLGMTMWDVLYPGQDKYPSANGNHFRVFELVTSGHRPVLDAGIHPRLRAVMESAWQETPRLRPSAGDIVAVLESVQEEVCGSFAVDMIAEFDDVTVESKQQQTEAQASGVVYSFSGKQGVEQMQRLNFVRSTGEAVRVGNALMDAGLLHHQKHARPFESSSAVYFFDDENVNLCQPLPRKPVGAIDEHSVENGSASNPSPRQSRHYSSTTGGRSTASKAASSRLFQDDSSADSESTAMLTGDGSCRCRRLGQRLEMPKATTRRRFRGKKKKKQSGSASALASRTDRQHQLQTRLLLASYDPIVGPSDRESTDLDEFDMLSASVSAET